MGNVWDAFARELRALKRKLERAEEEHVDTVASLRDELAALEQRIDKESKGAKRKDEDD